MCLIAGEVWVSEASSESWEAEVLRVKRSHALSPFPPFNFWSSPNFTQAVFWPLEDAKLRRISLSQEIILQVREPSSRDGKMDFDTQVM